MQRLDLQENRLRARLKRGGLFVFLDYDGTLVPIAGRPQDARTPAATARLLKRLASLPGCRVAVVSGRALSDIRKRVGVGNVVYVGNHGYEMFIPGKGELDYAPPGYRAVLSGIKRRITAGVKGIKGIVCEDKRISLALHFRLADKRGTSLAKKVFRGAVARSVDEGAAAVKKGKKVLEILPPGRHNKGTAVKEILRGAGDVTSLYLGDDRTDEDAFRALKHRGITVYVGAKRASAAGYYLNSPREAVLFLRELLALREESICRS
ncbi:MAG: trehalose-phosphatase [Candidatus Omnitrophota bacterium]|jgi:trehalose-phosphatase|nr:trehalose-phosphatase [Candidatus Omnitrophota bacterium]